MTNHTSTARTIHLISWGTTPAVTADSLNVGDVTVWNYGYRETVEAIVPAGAQSLKVTFRSESTGGLFTRMMRRNRLVGVTGTVR